MANRQLHCPALALALSLSLCVSEIADLQVPRLASRPAGAGALGSFVSTREMHLSSSSVHSVSPPYRLLSLSVC